MYTARYFLIWGIITLVTFVLAFAAYLWLSKVSRFENRKKEIACGMLVCVLAVSSLMFLPVLFSRIDLSGFGKKLFDKIQFAEFEAEDAGIKMEFAPYVRPFARFLAETHVKILDTVLLGIPALLSIVVIIITFVIIFKIREPKKTLETEYSRKHLFEYNGNIVSELNKKK